MDAFTPSMSERSLQPRESPPNLRNENETEISYLSNLIESTSSPSHQTHPHAKSSALAWILFPAKHPTCVLGRHPKPPDSESKFCASLYSMGKGGVKCLDIGPEMGESRCKVLGKLLVLVEVEVGRMMLKDARRAGGGG
ncbi:hypothetical protein P153DRAFT_398993 [Dothidotthia symphoricarpi CBS 119687]|uniref:Uncharacterized protein n=1 Tax=Dothidotthia symphoricarpi CBS 119687 TaxID=1392245 RepID=A0A6A6A7X7_9PLEO|nr:uncharacterized protein P153DRAFT_398993 [Dothidotthia symphoricarpi CBS 119687]KAF2126908.1 hypothetical protein P153DRAFT_398993 [Dothidotthia symphoricarpi CBS 119687]